jgi:NAD(P)-dependent dehydrogenase (short-subunit alcohol dehydrogenase family)/protein-disulfide isomerase
MGLLDGKVAIITGAGGGLGEAYAKLFAREGAAVVVNDLGGPRDGSGADVSMAQKVVNAIKEEGGRAVANGSDISTMAGGQSVFEDAIKNFGRADILVNNAGILLDETFAKAKEANWDRVIRVHLKGTFCCTQPVFKWMRENGGGVIVNTSSTSGLIGNFGQTNYGAAKGGIWGLSNVLAIEGRKYNIRVWTLAPGALTRMTADLPRYIENPKAALGPDGIAPAVLYMVSDLSGDQTGKVLGVSGPRGVREMRMMEMEGWKPPHEGWKAQDIVEHAKDIYRSPNAPVAGNPDGDITVVEFFDYNCGYCKRGFSEIAKLVEKDKNVRVVFKEFPILRDESEQAAKVALAARMQGKYWEVHSEMIQTKGLVNETVGLKTAEKHGLDMAKLKTDMASPEVKAELDRVKELAKTLSINGTPHFLVGDQAIGGAPENLYDVLEAHVTEFRKTGCAYC